MRTIKYSFMETCYACAAKPGVDFRTLRLNTDAYSDEIAAASKDFGVEESIVRAIIHAESAFNPNALSRVGAQGLMQLMPATARRFGVGNPFDAAQNIRGGVQYLAFLLKRFNGDLALAAAGYNAGEGAVDKIPRRAAVQRNPALCPTRGSARATLSRRSGDALMPAAGCNGRVRRCRPRYNTLSADSAFRYTSPSLRRRMPAHGAVPANGQ